MPQTSIATVTVGQFFTTHARRLKLTLVAGVSGLKRPIRQGAVNRPGLALTGFFKSFAEKRVQILGSHENAYLKSLTPDEQRQRVTRFFSTGIPCVIFARNIKPTRTFLHEAEQHSIPVFKSPLVTMRLVNTATICLELDFAPTTTEHGSMVDIQGIGVLIRGKSGVGKSEAVLGLIERGYSLVADDITRFTCIEGRDLQGTSSDITRHHMEVRGLGIINVGSMFGVGSIRLEKRLGLVVTIKDWEEMGDIDRTGLDDAHYEILGIRTPHVIVPVRPGRDVARLIEVAALDAKLKAMGHHSAAEFNQRLKAAMGLMER